MVNEIKFTPGGNTVTTATTGITTNSASTFIINGVDYPIHDFYTGPFTAVNAGSRRTSQTKFYKACDLNSIPLSNVSKIDFYQGKTTVVTFKDGKKISSTVRDEDVFDKETGVIMCLIKYIYGNSVFTSIRNKIKDCENYKKAQEEDKKKLKEVEKKNRALLKKESDYRKKVQNAPLKLLEEVKELKKQIEELKNNK